MNEPSEEVRRQFEERLSEHGYGFTYAALEAINKEPQGWNLRATEFPVGYEGRAPASISFFGTGKRTSS